MKNTILLSLSLLFVGFLYSQDKGITYQAVIYKPGGEQLPGENNQITPLMNSSLCLKFTFLDSQLNVEYQEIQKTTTDLFGMVNLVIGLNTQTGGYANGFNNIKWGGSLKKLKVEIATQNNCSNYEEISNEVFNYVPLSFSAIAAESVTGLVAIENGGTNATTVVGVKTNLGIQNVDNTSDANKPVSTATQKALDLKSPLASPTFTGTPEAPTATAGTNTKQIATTEFVTSAVSTANTTNANLTGPVTSVGNATAIADAALSIAMTNGLQTALAAKSNASDVTTNLATKVDKVTGKGLSTEDYTTAEKTKLAAITGSNTGDQDLSAYATQTALDLKAPIANPTFTGTVSGVTSAMVGLGDVDNTSDANKPVSTATQTALDLKAPIANPTFTGTVSGVTSTMVGLGNVDNTSDANKPVSTATQTALDLKAPLASPTFTGSPSLPTGTTGVTQSASNNSTKLATTAYADAQATAAVSGKQNTLTNSAGLAGALSDETGTGLAVFATSPTLTTPTIGVATATSVNKVAITAPTNGSTLTIADGKTLTVSNSLTLTGTDASTLNIGTGGTLGTNAYTSTAFAPIASPTFTGTVSGVTSTMVGLGNVDNTSDASKPVSTATQTALDLKAPLASPTFTGTPLAPTPTAGDNTTKVATTAFVTNAVSTATSGAFVDLTTGQTIAGTKVFSSNASFNGQKIGKGNATGGQNLAVGDGAMNGTSTGVRNTAIGNSAMQNYVGTGFDNNTSVGYNNLVGLTTGSGNTSIGAESMMALSTGTQNTSLGNQSLINTTGNNNVGIGKRAGQTLTSGSQNTIIGTNADVGTNNLTNATAIGYGAIVTADNTVQLGSTSVTDVKTSGTITAVGLSLSGSATANGTVTATSFTKSGGTSSEYLMADGSVSTGATAVREVADEFTATASQTSFTLTQPPSANSKVKMYVNGIRISNTAYSVSGSTLTYVPANNGGYTLTLSDRIQFDYFY